MSEIFQRIIVHLGHKAPLYGDQLVWKLDGVGQAALLEARGAMHEASQDAYYADGGTLNSMFEKLSYFWTHEGRGSVCRPSSQDVCPSCEEQAWSRRQHASAVQVSVSVP